MSVGGVVQHVHSRCPCSGVWALLAGELLWSDNNQLDPWLISPCRHIPELVLYWSYTALWRSTYLCYISWTCVVTRTHSIFAVRAFAAAGPGLWNSLLPHLRDADLPYSRFRRSLKTFLFVLWTILTAPSRKNLTYLLTCAAGLKAILSPVATDDPVAWSVCTPVTLVHPAKAVGRNEMPFGKETRVAPSSIALDRGSAPPTERGDFGDRIEDRKPQSTFENCGQTVTDIRILLL